MFKTETEQEERLGQVFGVEARKETEGQEELIPTKVRGIGSLDVMEVAKKTDLRGYELVREVQEKRGIPIELANDIATDLEDEGVLENLDKIKIPERRW